VKTLIIALGLTLAAPQLAAAEDPWATGVPDAQQDQANAIYEEGNALFAQDAHAPALEKYRAAIALWDHPRIRFNLAVTLIRLDRPLEAAEELEQALRFGDKPFKKDLYQQALDYQRLLQGRVGYIEASCDHKGAQVLLDGKPWFACPGAQKVRVMAGEHALVGELRDFVPDGPSKIVVAGGGVSTHKVRLKPIASAVELRYPLPRWVPITLAITGGVVGLAGAGTYLAGKTQMSEFEDNFAIECPMGCAKDLSDNLPLREQRDSAELKGTLGVGMMITGGAVFVGGLVMIVVNRPKRILPSLEVAAGANGMAASTSWSF
jgi:hypothetical protein